MRSSLPKVLHAIAGRSMLGHVLATAQAAGAGRLALVVAPGMEAVRAEAAKVAPGIEVFEQATQAGTAHAVLAAAPAIERHRGDVIVLFADTPLVEPGTLRRLSETLRWWGASRRAGLYGADATGYGRLMLGADGRVEAIREERDATDAERRIGLCNAGAMGFRVPDLVALLGAHRQPQRQERVLSHRRGGRRGRRRPRCQAGRNVRPRRRSASIRASSWPPPRPSSRRRARRRVMERRATLVAPETVWLSFDTMIGSDVTIEPNVFFGPGVVVEDGAHILANCHMVGAHIGKGARIGPFARFRPGADIGESAHVGNFVEVKNARLESGAKANHLSYIGDGRVGEGANIGAGTIFCNYDGFNKHFTDVGKGAFVGSNSSLVAPVKIGDGAYIGSGSVISKDVEPDALALERSTQETRPGWAAKFRALMGRRRNSSKPSLTD